MTRASADLWADVTAARLPAAGLPALAAVRDAADVRVHADGDGVWVTWPVNRADVAVRLRPVEGVRFYARRDGVWHRFNSRLPSAERPPAGDGSPLAAALLPGRFALVSADTGVSPVPVRLVRGGPPAPAVAFTSSLEALARWADATTSAEIAGVQAARLGTRVAALGTATVPGAVRFWGDGVFAPVGFRFEPDLPPALVRAAAGAEPTDRVFVTADAVDVIPAGAFAPLTRAGVRRVG